LGGVVWGTELWKEEGAGEGGAAALGRGGHQEPAP
jgi:hypothetical protein